MPESAVSDTTGAVTDRLDLAAVLAGLTVKQRAVVVLRDPRHRTGNGQAAMP
jgi:DNA-directed RNA polymerase specialized sigma24 family protein